ncbi:arsenic transporter [Lebetimonas sp. JH292]|uniref:arsenic transporter n=1 Tax=Lebetimonas sp. JH292 TaxID=990068 RepID=UPI0004666783|nr:arsenic transporter [Lebetimonas sp. JH292]
MILAVSIFLITLIFIIWQPKGIQIGTTAVIGAVVSLILGVVSFEDIIEVIKIVWDATLAFIGIVILSMVLDKLGFFEYMAIKIAKLSRGNGNLMFINSMLLGSVVSAFFANDGAALILTPILLSKLKMLKLNLKTITAFLLAGGFISDSASLPFVFSNLTNIVTADFFHIGFFEYFKNMFFPFIVSTIASTFILWLFLRKNIPNKIDIDLLPPAKSVIKDEKLFIFSFFFLALLLIGYFIGDFYHIPVSVFALGGALIFLIISHKKVVDAKEIILTAPWQIVWFSIGLYIVVYGLKNAGLTDYLSIILKHLLEINKNLAIIATGFISAFLSAVMNNLPTIMIMDISLKHIGNEAMIYANIIGSNLGPKMTPFGSLATLLWLHVLEKKGVKITFKEYTKFGLIITPPVLLIVLLILI